MHGAPPRLGPPRWRGPLQGAETFGKVLRFSAFSSPSIRRRAAMSSLSAAGGTGRTSRMRLNNAGAARKTNGYTEQTRYRPRGLTLRCKFPQRANVAQIRRRAHPAYPRSCAAPSLPQFDVTHMARTNLAHNNSALVIRLSQPAFHPSGRLQTRAPLNNAEQIIAGAPSNVGIAE